MRIALAATTLAAVAAIPLAIAVTSPAMSSDQFLTAVRCAAYADVTQARAPDGAKWALNSEARRQSAETVAEAEAEVAEIARQAVNAASAEDAVMIRREAAAACSQAEVARSVDARGAA